MNRWWAAGLAVAALLVAGVAAAVVLASGSTTLSVAYVTAGTASPEVWVRPLSGGTPQRIGPGTAPLLSPDGSLVAATGPPSGAGAGALRLYSTSGGSPHRDFTAADVTATPLAFSPDGRYLAVGLQSRDPASTRGSGLAIIDTSSFRATVVAHGQIDGASFAPGSDRIAYASARSPALTAAVDISVIRPDGSGATQITHDGHSLYPVWGKTGIAFDHERLRRQAEPAYEVWIMTATGRGRRPLTTMAVPRLRDGLQPVAFSEDGRVLLADYVGPNTSQAWLLRLPDGRATPLPGAPDGAALSRDGASVLIDRGGFLNPAAAQTIASQPVTGGTPRTLVPGATEPSWNA